MPIYEYRCTVCDHKLEALQKMAEPPLQICPRCNNPTLQKLISAVSFRLKGGGWYETDFKEGHKKNLHEDAGEATPKPATEAPTTPPEAKSPTPATPEAKSAPAPSSAPTD